MLDGHSQHAVRHNAGGVHAAWQGRAGMPEEGWQQGRAVGCSQVHSAGNSPGLHLLVATATAANHSRNSLQQVGQQRLVNKRPNDLQDLKGLACLLGAG